MSRDLGQWWLQPEPTCHHPEESVGTSSLSHILYYLCWYSQVLASLGCAVLLPSDFSHSHLLGKGYPPSPASFFPPPSETGHLSLFSLATSEAQLLQMPEYLHFEGRDPQEMLCENPDVGSSSGTPPMCTMRTWTCTSPSLGLGFPITSFSSLTPK